MIKKICKWLITAAMFALGSLGGQSAAAQNIGCKFDKLSLTFAGSPKMQATCLLKKVGIGGSLQDQPLPSGLADKVGMSFKPTADQLKYALRGVPLPIRNTLLSTLNRPVSKTASGSYALYFVIHDTSSPYLKDQPFPDQIDSAPFVNCISGYLGPNAVAHYFVNRTGEIGIGHDFSIPWRATKFESKIIGEPSRGRFLHVESLQPRRRDPNAGGPNNDRLAPEPGFGDGQYKSLVGLYVLASARAGIWLIPAFHAAIDQGISDGHDDPQRFDLAKFDAVLNDAMTAPINAASPQSAARALYLLPSQATGRWGNDAVHSKWTEMGYQSVSELGKDLWKSGFVPNDIATFCPSFASQNEDGRKSFWVGLISSLSKFESDFNPKDKYKEKFNDVHGNPVISRGLLQISIESGNGYGCRLTDAQQLYDPATNLACAVRILNKQVPRAGSISAYVNGKWVGAASYWHPFRRAADSADLASWTAKQSYCAAN